MGVPGHHSSLYGLVVHPHSSLGEWGRCLYHLSPFSLCGTETAFTCLPSVQRWLHPACVSVQYRTGQNYRNPAWLGPRIGDKLLISLIILTLYLGIGDNLAPDNLINIQSSLFMWALLPAFGAASYVPAIVLGGYSCGMGSMPAGRAAAPDHRAEARGGGCSRVSMC